MFASLYRCSSSTESIVRLWLLFDFTMIMSDIQVQLNGLKGDWTSCQSQDDQKRVLITASYLPHLGYTACH
jgi:hypothetical protein